MDRFEQEYDDKLLQALTDPDAFLDACEDLFCEADWSDAAIAHQHSTLHRDWSPSRIQLATAHRDEARAAVCAAMSIAADTLHRRGQTRNELALGQHFTRLICAYADHAAGQLK